MAFDPAVEFVETQRLAATGACKCRKCEKVSPLEENVTVNYGGALAVAVCTECFSKVDVVITRNVNGIAVEIRPRSILLVSV